MSAEIDLYNTLKEIYFCLDNGDRLLLDDFNLSVPRYYLLKHLEETPGISFTQLSQLMLSDKSNISRLIKNMEAEGLVRRKRHSSDGRTRSLYLTPAGKKVLEAARRAHRRYIETRFAWLDGGRDQLLSSLREIKKSLADSLPQDVVKG